MRRVLTLVLFSLFGAGLPILASAAAAASATSVFRSACLEGQARFAPAQAAPVKKSAVPSSILRYLSNTGAHIQRNTQFFQLTLPEGPAYLILGGSNVPKTPNFCSVASKNIAYWTALTDVERRGNYEQTSPEDRRQMERMGFHRAISSDGYVIIIRRIEGGYVTMTTILNAGKNKM